MTTIPTFTVGQAVEIVDTFNSRALRITTGNVERITKTQVHVRRDSGSLSRFRVKDARQVGYAWPQLTEEIRELQNENTSGKPQN